MKIPKTILKILPVIALIMIIAFSSTANNEAHALLSSGTLSISGSSTVYPCEVDASATFPAYYTSITGDTITLNINAGGSGVAIPNMVSQADDIGAMSRPPTDAEFNSMPDLQQYAIGIDSVAIVVNPYLSPWIQNVTVTQVADLFETYNNSGVQTPFYTTWNQFNPAAPNEPIERAVRDPTSGTFDCFYNFFLKPAGFPQTETNSSAQAQLAPYTYCQNNIDVLNTITGSGGQDYIGFISLGYLHYGGLSALNIWNSALSTYVVPSDVNVRNGSYLPWRFLWVVVNGTIPADMSNPNFVIGLWIAYLKLPSGYAPGVSFLVHEDYLDLYRADMAGATPFNSTLQPETHLQPTQTQTYPDSKVDINDVTYFIDAYSNYYTYHIYNPYADMNADGKIDYNDIVLFAQDYIAANSGLPPP
jgi:ABC-type phosphate transport system substrate-binding protein